MGRGLSLAARTRAGVGGASCPSSGLERAFSQTWKAAGKPAARAQPEGTAGLFSLGPKHPRNYFQGFVFVASCIFHLSCCTLVLFA